MAGSQLERNQKNEIRTNEAIYNHVCDPVGSGCIRAVCRYAGAAAGGVVAVFSWDQIHMQDDAGPQEDTVSLLLRRARDGDVQARERVFERVYDDLRAMASHRLAAFRADGVIQTTALVNSTCERLLEQQSLDAESRRHLFFLLGRAMQNVLVDYIRRANAQKRGGGLRRVELGDPACAEPSSATDIEELRGALERLAGESPLSAEAVMLRFFAGRTMEQTAELMGCSLGEAKGHWEYARVWLRDRVSNGNGNR